MYNNKLKVNSIFESISGEAGFFPQGTWCTFIRLQGCNFFPRPCDYCDTLSAQNEKEGRWISIEKISNDIKQRHVLITGGEPLMQKEPLISLIMYLLNFTDCQIQIETNGSIHSSFMEKAYPRVGWILDYKLASSGMTGKMLPLHMFIDILNSTNNNYLKFVVADPKDLSQAIDVCEKLIQLQVRYKNFIISPVDGEGMLIPNIVRSIKNMAPSLLDHVIFSVQLQKLLDLP